MQDNRSIGGGRIFSGGGDRRLRPQHQQNNQSLNCPRCDSLNTKFCYYNNYNLSQPRHFCKNCRRYWTKGGVLRNVPVGGGCRKAKRSKTKPSSESTATPQQQHKANSHSSSESTSTHIAANNSNVAVTNKNTTTTNSSVAEAASAVTSHSNNINVNESKLYGNPSNSLVFEQGFLEQGSDSGIFPDIGSFTSLVSSSNNETSSFGFSTVLNGQGQWRQQQQQQQKMMTTEEITGGFLDQTLQDELSNLHGRSWNGFGPLDWQGSEDQPLFDLPNTVDETYWSQSQWTDQDHPTLYLP